jgi:hypothetical protein
MKTTKIFSVLSLVLIFAAVTSTFAAAIDNKNNPVNANQVIRYHVNIAMTSESQLCNMWLVEILDGNGRLVAPAKPYSSNVTRYDFFERGPVTGTRIAVLVINQYGDHYICDRELFVKPDALSGTFLNGQTYRFDLFPTVHATKREIEVK